MRELNGNYTTALAFSDCTEEYALAQVQQLINQPALTGSKVRIMPDVHPGKIGPVGFTATVTDRVMPGIVGIDIGCGVTVAKLKGSRVEYRKLDAVIRENVPSGYQICQTPHRFCDRFDFSRLHCARHIDRNRAARSLGTLGGGNHFIELDRDDNGDLYIVIHSGSRHLGKETAEHYLKAGQKRLKAIGVNVPYELSWVEGALLDDYLNDVSEVQKFADINREAILDSLCKGMKWKVTELWTCVHNYIDTGGREAILRKGAISAKKGETVIIPINMRDGVLMGYGKGNPNWNESAPHGAGRILNRSAVRERYTVSQFKKAMQGVYSPSIGKETLDEAPFAYRGTKEILAAVSETVTIEKTLKPVYNFKAGGNE